MPGGRPRAACPRRRRDRTPRTDLAPPPRPAGGDRAGAHAGHRRRDGRAACRCSGGRRAASRTRCWCCPACWPRTPPPACCGPGWAGSGYPVVGWALGRNRGPDAGGGRRAPPAGRPAGRRARDVGERRRLEPRRHLRPAAGPAGARPGAAGHLAGLAVRAVRTAGRRQPRAPGVPAAGAGSPPERRHTAPAARSPGRCRCRARRSTPGGTASSTGGPAGSSRARGARTWRCAAATWAWATTPPSSGWSPTGWPSRGTSGGRSSGRPGSGSAALFPPED